MGGRREEKEKEKEKEKEGGNGDEVRRIFEVKVREK